MRNEPRHYSFERTFAARRNAVGQAAEALPASVTQRPSAPPSSEPTRRPRSSSGVFQKAVESFDDAVRQPGVLQLILVSKVARPMSPAELVEWVLEARRFHGRHQVTGVLLHKDGCLLCALEGPDSGVSAVYQRMKEDRLLVDFAVLSTKVVNTRQHSTLPLSFHNLSELEQSGPPSVRSFASVPLTPKSLAQNPARAEQLLVSLRART